MHPLYEFLDSQKLMIIASQGPKIWIANMYYCVDTDIQLYFISSTQTTHSKQILNNPDIAFSVSWFNPENHKDRKGIQGLGSCTIVDDPEEIKKGIAMHNTRFPEFTSKLTVDHILSKDTDTMLWKITPTEIKYWNDADPSLNTITEYSF